MLVASPTAGWEITLAIAARGDGGFVVVWHQNGKPHHIRGRAFNADGSTWMEAACASQRHVAELTSTQSCGFNGWDHRYYV